MPARFPSVRPALESGGERSADVAGEEGAAPESDSYALAAAIAIGASRGSREIDFRRGPFVYRASFSILRQKAWHIAALAGALLLAARHRRRRQVLEPERTSARCWTRTSRRRRRSCSASRASDAEAITQLMKQGLP